MKQRKIPFLKLDTTIPVIRLYLEDGVYCNVLIDSGSDTTVYDAAFIRTNRAKFTVEQTQKQANYVGINSKDIRPIVLAKTTLYMEDSGLGFDITGEIMNLSDAFEEFYAVNDIKPHALLGGRDLDQLKAKIDYENKELILQQ